MTTGLNHGYGGVNVNKKLNVKGFCTDLAYDLVGSVLYAAGIVCFVNPANMAPGGMSGVAILLNYLWGLPIGTMTIVLNIPLLILSYIFLGKSLTWKTVKSLVISSLMVDLVMARYAPVYAGDRMIGGVFGGVLMGGKVQQCVGDAQIVGGQTEVPVVLHRLDEAAVPGAPGIQVYDATTDEDLARIGGELGTERLRLSAGCAGFATALADVLGLNGTEPQMPQLPSAFFVACGSVNPVTLRQMRWAEQNGFVHIHLELVQKLEPAWLESEDCGIKIRIWLEQARNSGRCILDVNDPMGLDDTAVFANTHGLTTEDLRVRISTQLAHLMKRLLDGGLDAAILCTGGDTLLALMRTVGTAELTPVRELTTGAVLTNFVYRGKTYYIISKSGGFGEPDLFCKLAAFVRAGSQKEDAVC